MRGLGSPYYQDRAVTIYHGDCREIMPTLPLVDAIVTDPPYGTGWVRGGGMVGEFKACHEKPEWDVWTTDWLSLLNAYHAHIAVFGPASRTEEMRAWLGNLWWYEKTNPRPNGPSREPIATTMTGERVLRHYNGDCPLHPTQKPYTLMLELVHAIPGQLILDPFSGSGSTLLAAKDLGRKAIGIEQDERYCEIAAKRMAQEVLF